MKKTALAVFAAAGTAVAASSAELKVTADRVAADQRTGSLVASGHVNAVSHPFRLLAEEFRRDAENRVTLSNPTTLTTCTNDLCSLHWRATGEAEFQPDRYVAFRNLWLYAWEVPVMWLPYWYYPLDTEYGLRFMPGYTARWGAYFMSKYVYHLAGDPSHEDGSFWLRGGTRLDLRSKNGIAFGQSLDWQLGDCGKGRFKIYHVWDQDHDRYTRHWRDTSRWNYGNWGSTVPFNRYAIELGHRWEVTERDTLRAHGLVYSDSHFQRDFLRNSLFNNRNLFVGYSNNEIAWEHNESMFGAGISASGPLNDFSGGTARLPEVYFDVMPVPLWSLPVNYESESRMGYLDRRASRYGDSHTSIPFRYNPGPWADYNTFRLDTYHRLTAPFKVADVLSVVPRVGVRGTYWGEGGYTSLDGLDRAGTTGDDMVRAIVEGGVTFAARGTAWIDDRWQHLLEPYADVLLQEATYSGDGSGKRPYVFDSIDASRDWQDQFAGSSRSLPYSWYGVTPGLRNAFRRADEKGVLRTVFDVDAYAAVQFNESEWTEGNRYHRLAKVGEPNYGRHSPTVMPGVRMRWLPATGMALSARCEFDAENNRIAYSSVRWSHRPCEGFRYYAEYIGRDHRWWDYSSTAYDSSTMRNEDFNWARYGFAEVGFEHDLCDAVAWGPFIRWDCREDDLDEVGTWIDYRTDCLGFRFQVGYENEYTRIDGSEHDHDWRFGFYVYLRAFGPEWGDLLKD